MQRPPSLSLSCVPSTILSSAALPPHLDIPCAHGLQRPQRIYVVHHSRRLLRALLHLHQQLLPLPLDEPFLGEAVSVGQNTLVSRPIRGVHQRKVLQFYGGILGSQDRPRIPRYLNLLQPCSSPGPDSARGRLSIE